MQNDPELSANDIVWASRTTGVFGFEQLPALAQAAGKTLPPLGINSFDGVAGVNQDAIDAGVSPDEAMQAHFDFKNIETSSRPEWMVDLQVYASRLAGKPRRSVQNPQFVAIQEQVEEEYATAAEQYRIMKQWSVAEGKSKIGPCNQAVEQVVLTSSAIPIHDVLTL